MTPRRMLAAVVVLAVLGGVALGVSGGVALNVVGIVLCGVAAVVLVCIAFLMVGEAEDRDRAREHERHGP